MTGVEILAVINRKAEVHPELGGPLGWNGFRRILTREGIGLHIAPLPHAAQLVQFRGRWTILLDSSYAPRRHLWKGTHELGHLWLHHDRCWDRAQRVYNMGRWEEDEDPHECDAEIFSHLVIHGPTVRDLYRNRESGFTAL